MHINMYIHISKCVLMTFNFEFILMNINSDKKIIYLFVYIYFKKDIIYLPL